MRASVNTFAWSPVVETGEAGLRTWHAIGKRQAADLSASSQEPVNSLDPPRLACVTPSPGCHVQRCLCPLRPRCIANGHFVAARCSHLCSTAHHC